MAGARADAMMEPRPRRGFVVFKWLMYALLAGDVVLYALFGRLTELVDTAAWLVLLLLFEWETGGWSLPSRLRPALHGVRAIAERRGVTAAQVALAWVLAQGDHVVPIPGTKRRRWLEENAAAADLVLEPEDLADIAALPPSVAPRY